MDFCDRFDLALFQDGFPAIFTVDADGRLRFDAERTRDCWGRLGRVPAREVAHFLVRDRATGWVQYVLATSPEIFDGHPRCEAVRYPDEVSALTALEAVGIPPIRRGG